MRFKDSISKRAFKPILVQTVVVIVYSEINDIREALIALTARNYEPLLVHCQKLERQTRFNVRNILSMYLMYLQSKN